LGAENNEGPDLEALRAAFSELGRGLSAARTPEEAARIIVAVAQDLLGWDACSLDLYSPESQTVQAVLTMDTLSGEGPVDVPHAYAAGPPGPMTQKVLSQGSQLILRDQEMVPQGELTPFGTGRRSASLMFVPIRHGDRINGILSIQSYTPNAYDDADLTALQGLADHCGGALERMRIETALRESEQQLRQAQKMEAVGQLAGGIAHDFNNLLTSIIGCSELLMANLAPADPRRVDVAEISRSAHRAAALTRQLLAFSRKQVLQPRVINLNTVITDLGSMLHRVLGERVALKLELDPQLGRVLADPGQLEQVVANLCVNARDAMPEGGQLTLATTNVSATEAASGSLETFPLSGSLIALSVSDTGVGMDQDTMAHLFEPFFTTKELGRGTGLGLATVYGIVRQSGGHIQVSSRPREGSRFTVYLPMVQGDVQSESDAGPALASPGGSETVLVVEDDEAVRHLVSRVLKSKGYRVLLAEKGSDALAIAADGGKRIDLIVTDVVMPDLSGPALVTQLRHSRPGLRALFITGYAEEVIGNHGVLGAGSALLEKPFTANQLAHKIREILAPAPS
jgi:two-component system cell cycle sensor histidine kinase/response regulator CckA